MTEMERIYYYVSTRANTYNPSKTVFLIPPQKFATDEKVAEEYAISSGVKNLVEENGDVLIVPVLENGYDCVDGKIVEKIYTEYKKTFSSKEEGDNPEATVWCWETLIYIIGVGDGAVLAGNAAVASPNYFAGVALLGGVPSDYSHQNDASSHWYVQDVTSDYCVKNRDIPVPVWFFVADEGVCREACDYFMPALGIDKDIYSKKCYGKISAKLFENVSESARNIRITTGEFCEKEAIECVYENFFSKQIRWKNAPDGTLKPILTKKEFYSTFETTYVSFGGYEYPVYVYLPKGETKESMKNKPVVFSLHGRYEPSWIFSTKNGWVNLCDETKEFVYVLVDCYKNEWVLDRDVPAFGKICDMLSAKYSIDRERVYVSGFSNGNRMTSELGIYRPNLFAAMSPWNGPNDNKDFSPLVATGLEMPTFAFVGDNDHGGMNHDGGYSDIYLQNIMTIDNCPRIPFENKVDLHWFTPEIRTGENYYNKKGGYTEGDRLRTFIYRNDRGEERVGYTVMKNMPHGAIYDESRATWEFFKQFRRKANGEIEVIK